MPYADHGARLAYSRAWYAANRKRQIAAVTARRRKPKLQAAPVSRCLDGWEERQRYAMEVAKRRYPRLFWRERADVQQIAALVAITTPEMGKDLARAMERACYRLEKEIL